MYSVFDYRRVVMFLWRFGGVIIVGVDFLVLFCVKFLCMCDIYVYFM